MQSLPQLKSLQLLRALAAISVVYYHLQPTLNFGSFGVDIFFVLSGFLIAMVVSHRADPMSFAIARISRVVPIYWMFTVIIFVVAYGAPTLLNSTTADIENLLKSLLFIPYFKENGELHPMLAVGWTLSYEMFFYSLMLLALMSRVKRPIAVTVALIFAVYGVGCMLPTTTALGTFLQNEKMFEFIFGMVIFRIYRAPQLLNKIPLWVAWISLLAAYGLMAYRELNEMALHMVYLGVPASVIVLMALRLEPIFAGCKGFVMRLFVYLGDASYAIYLSHVYVVEGMRKIIAPQVAGLAPTTPLGGLCTLILALVVGSIAYQLMDRPSSKWLRQWLSQRLLPPVAST